MPAAGRTSRCVAISGCTSVAKLRHRLALLVVAACGHAPATSLTPRPSLPRLLPPAPIDSKVHGAAYLNAVALQLQPGWGQFLDDCRLRLPPEHPLNQASLAATAELSIDGSGGIAAISLASSGNPDFDRAARDAIADASPLPAPPTD